MRQSREGSRLKGPLPAFPGTGALPVPREGDVAVGATESGRTGRSGVLAFEKPEGEPEEEPDKKGELTEPPPCAQRMTTSGYLQHH